MKPFRGKPEKPKRSNGEIHRQRGSLPCGFAMSRDFGLAIRYRCGMSGHVGVHFSPSRTSRPVGCRPTARMVDCCVAFTRVHAADLRCNPAYCPAVWNASIGIERHTHIACVLAPRQARPARIYGPSAVVGCSTRPFSRVCPRTGWIPVGDATALGTFRTRLETRTKESNMCASHWDIFNRNLKAQ